jgi:hypothetical protein
MRALVLPVLALFVGLPGAGGIEVPLGQDGIERALVVGRAFDAERARFHRPYLITIGDATVEQIEIITEFRRVVLMTEDRSRRGDHLFRLRQAEEALGPWRGRLTIVTRLRFHPQNAYVAAPLFEIAIGPPPLSPLDVRRNTLFASPIPHQRSRTSLPLTGAVVEADFEAASIGRATRTVSVVLDGKNVASTTIDFSRLD